jgi:hypothetical protein
MNKARYHFEHYSQPLLPWRSFLLRLTRHGGIALVLLVFSLLMGMVGYHLIGRLTWVDAFLNASMILTGMGPVSQLATVEAKIFSGCYALYSGIAFLTSMGVLFAPVLHRVMHKFHLGRQ